MAVAAAVAVAAVADVADVAAVAVVEKVRKTCVKLRFWIKNLRFPLPFAKFSYGDLTFVGTSATECKFLLFHLK